MLRVDMVCFVYATIGIGLYDPSPIFLREKIIILQFCSYLHPTTVFSVLNPKGIYMSANGGGGGGGE